MNVGVDGACGALLGSLALIGACLRSFALEGAYGVVCARWHSLALVALGGR